MPTDARRAANARYAAANKDKIKAKQTEWRLANKELRHKQQRERAQHNKLRAVDYCGGKCAHCQGIFHPAVYDFHHTDPAEKDGIVSKMLSLSWSKIKTELDKCILLCANCHRLVHTKD